MPELDGAQLSGGDPSAAGGPGAGGRRADIELLILPRPAGQEGLETEPG